jgi:adenylate cyclase
MRIVCSYDANTRVFEGDMTDITVGRSRPNNPVDLDLSPDQKVSRQHCRIVLEAGEYWIEDLGSVHGTYIADIDIRGKGRQRLQRGDAIRVGDTRLELDIVAEKPTSPDVTTDPAGTAPAADITAMLDASRSAFRATEQPTAEDAGRLTRLYELLLQFGAETHLDSLLQKIVEGVVEAIPRARRGALLIKDQATGHLLLKAFVSDGEPSVSLTYAQRALDQRQGFIWQHGFDPSVSQLIHNIGSGMYVPLIWKGAALGVLCVDNHDSLPPFTAEDLRFMLAVAQQAAMAVVQQQLQQDLQRNAALMERLLANFSPKVRDRLLSKARLGRLRLGGDRSEVSILISDIRGFTRMSAAMDAEDVLDLLNEYFTPLVAAIFRHDGTIDKFVGDSIVAVFGSPEPDPQQHERAVRAALAMRAVNQEVSGNRASRRKVSCDMGFGVHCGEVVHGFIGSEERMEFTVVGDAVNLTARYCDGAAPGEIVISPEMYQYVWRLVQTERISIPTKHEGTLPAYRVIALRA